MPIVAIAFLGSFWLSLGAWNSLHTPRLVDIFWSPTLNMWEPIYYPAPSLWMQALLFLPTVIVMWWDAPLYFQIPYTLSLLYSLLLAWAYYPCYPCIGVTGANK